MLNRKIAKLERGSTGSQQSRNPDGQCGFVYRSSNMAQSPARVEAAPSVLAPFATSSQRRTAKSEKLPSFRLRRKVQSPGPSRVRVSRAANPPETVEATCVVGRGSPISASVRGSVFLSNPEPIYSSRGVWGLTSSPRVSRSGCAVWGLLSHSYWQRGPARTRQGLA
jgi:hypothetical protein